MHNNGNSNNTKSDSDDKQYTNKHKIIYSSDHTQYLSLIIKLCLCFSFCGFPIVCECICIPFSKTQTKSHPTQQKMNLFAPFHTHIFI